MEIRNFLWECCDRRGVQEDAQKGLTFAQSIANNLELFSVFLQLPMKAFKTFGHCINMSYVYRMISGKLISRLSVLRVNTRFTNALVLIRLNEIHFKNLKFGPDQIKSSQFTKIKCSDWKSSPHSWFPKIMSMFEISFYLYLLSLWFKSPLFPVIALQILPPSKLFPPILGFTESTRHAPSTFGSRSDVFVPSR